MTGKRAEAYALYCRARSVAYDSLKKRQSLTNTDQVHVFMFWGLLYFGVRSIYIKLLNRTYVQSSDEVTDSMWLTLTILRKSIAKCLVSIILLGFFTFQNYQYADACRL